MFAIDGDKAHISTAGSGTTARKQAQCVRSPRVLGVPCGAYRLGSFVLDPGRGELRRGREAVALSRQAVAVVACLARNHPHCVTHRELLAAAWLGVAVGGGSLRLAIWEARKALATDPSLRDAIQTARGRGYRLVAPVAPAAFETSPSLRDEIVNRADELSRLTAMLEQATRFEGRACAITGPIGTGKTRLMRALAQRALERGIAVREGRGEPDGGAPPLWPWIQMFKTHLDAMDARLRKDCERATPRVWQLVTRQSSVTTGPIAEPMAPEVRFILFTEFLHLLAWSSERCPMLLLFDDLHSADETSQALFAYLARELRKCRVLLVVACRQRAGPEGAGAARALEALAQEPLNEHVPLHPLGVGALEDLLANQRGEDVSPAGLERIRQITDGKPRPAHELVSLSGAEGPTRYGRRQG